MVLSGLKLVILTDRLEKILSTPNMYPNKDDYITDEIFEDMLCLATDIDLATATKIYQKIYQEADRHMAYPLLRDIIAKHIADI